MWEASGKIGPKSIWSAARQLQGAQRSLVSACGGLGLRPASQCHFDAISGPDFQFEAHKLEGVAWPGQCDTGPSRVDQAASRLEST